MPKSRRPTYTLHASTGQARVRIEGKDHYLGAHDSPESIARFDRLIDEWMRRKDVSRATLTIDELALRFMDHATSYYVKGGQVTSEVCCIRAALRPLVKAFGHTLAVEFGPLRLKDVRQSMIAAGWRRTAINRQLSRIRRMFAWGVENELVPETVYRALATVKGLGKGRSEAIEGEPVKAVPLGLVDAIQPYVTRFVWSMIELQLATGARPGEIVSMRVGDINTSGDVWEYVPREHKTEHRGKDRSILLGPKAQAIVREFLKPNVDAFLFSPAEADAERQQKRRAERKSPLTPSQIARQPKKNGQRRPKDHYTVASYRRAITRGCVVAKIPEWHPHQLRHTRATELRRRFGVEAARVVLGHSTIDATEIYAEADMARARQIALEVG